MADIAEALWEAPFVLLAHDLPEAGAGGQPTFSYANRAALDLFEAEWGDLIGQPSSISADADAQVPSLPSLPVLLGTPDPPGCEMEMPPLSQES